MPHFPNIFRFITELPHKRIISVAVVTISCLLAVLIFLQVISIASSVKLLRAASVEQERVEKEYAYWEQVVERYPGYAGGAYQAAIHAYKLNKKGEGDKYMDEALRIDPYLLERN